MLSKQNVVCAINTNFQSHAFSLQGHSLKPPYGKCGEQGLTYFSDYQEVNCHRECWNMYVMTKCGRYELDLQPYVNSSTTDYHLCSPKDKEKCGDME